MSKQKKNAVGTMNSKYLQRKHDKRQQMMRNEHNGRQMRKLEEQLRVAGMRIILRRKLMTAQLFYIDKQLMCTV